MLKMVYLLPFCLLLLGGGVVGCSSSIGTNGLNFMNASANITKISALQQIQNTAVTVYLQGQVTNRAPFLTNGAYQIKDDTGTIWVLTSQTLPNIGDIVLINGQLQFQSISLGGQDFGEVYVQERQIVERRAGQPIQPTLPVESYEQ